MHPRKPFGAIALIIGITLYVALVGLASGYVGGWPILAQAVLYFVLGLAWVPLFMPLVRWIETGRFTKPRPPATPAATPEDER